ncbi:hypothetical protein E4T66_05930 [Sinimarinibacterium sp. CAU 1509]|uniref:acetoacetate decarboxylase family protein n=1 Tax=Sinimarinibacterium sp. CAU 1509 TaxID=2562283 RepID=UPI0010AC2422|nr:acetoacetate decarboxylase family protein [Sinimarinibacterium sp. CAU 1509]TJY63237.1 hypothetical protein E4T66_05930 [Sinimarinibacterium sp. CAU 1509]
MNAPAASAAREPAIANAPAPWLLHGRGYIAMLRFPDNCVAQDAFLPPSLAGRRGASRYGWMMFVDYASSDVGPYHELLFIPGSFPFADGKRHLSISRIFVSSMDSVVNGQRNWGIPKDVAQFDVRYGQHGVDQVRVSKNGSVFAELEFSSLPIWLPFSSVLVPRSLRTLGQHHDGQTYIYSPSASGWIKPARLRRARFDSAVFPDLGEAKPVLAVQVPRFRMTFPTSQVIPSL